MFAEEFPNASISRRVSCANIFEFLVLQIIAFRVQVQNTKRVSVVSCHCVVLNHPARRNQQVIVSRRWVNFQLSISLS